MIYDYVDFMEKERLRQGITRDELERMSGISASTFTKWARGENKPQLEPYILVMRALGYEIVARRKKNATKKDGQQRRQENAV